ncbi:probable G-protein coupled receptor Mth-like 2 [Zeugodacus cucurbitae]|nr:probable G-protein coupled receptor Mth-like 2 [Zeugodacus cucurbitae]
MRIQHLIVCIVIYLLDCHRVLTEIPHCAFEDTVNITASRKFPNGSYSYQNVLVPKHLTGNYSYIELYDGNRKTVEKHLRGCVCQLKPCVKFCCHEKERVTLTNGRLQCSKWKKINYSPFLNITLQNGYKRKMNILTEFVVQQGIPCDMGFPSGDPWELTEDGKITQHMSQAARDYCIFPYPISGTKSWELNAINCPPQIPLSIKVNTMLMLTSVPFLYATILIYWWTGNLKSLNGKCIVCYIFSLANGTMLIVIANFPVTVITSNDFACALIGFVAYYFLTAVFFWLNVICFDLWQNVCFTTKFTNKTNTSEHKRLLYYSLYAWGLPAVMTIITVIIQYSSLPDELKPGIGDTVCFLKTNDWSAMLYFHGLFLLLISFNIVVFYLTVKHVFSVRSNLQMLRSHEQAEDRINRLRVLQENIWQFLRLFIIMGINWLLEIFAYLLDRIKEYEVIFYIINAFTASQGIILFIILVMTKKNRKIIKKAIKDIFSKLRFQRPKAHI